MESSDFDGKAIILYIRKTCTPANLRPRLTLLVLATTLLLGHSCWSAEEKSLSAKIELKIESAGNSKTNCELDLIESSGPALSKGKRMVCLENHGSLTGSRHSVKDTIACKEQEITYYQSVSFERGLTIALLLHVRKRVDSQHIRFLIISDIAASHQRRGSADLWGRSGSTGAKRAGLIDKPRENARMTVSGLLFARLQTNKIHMDFLSYCEAVRDCCTLPWE